MLLFDRITAAAQQSRQISVKTMTEIEMICAEEFNKNAWIIMVAQWYDLLSGNISAILSLKLILCLTIIGQNIV